MICCSFCGHELDVHEPVGRDRDDDREILECTVTGCRCEVLEGDA